MLLAAVALWLLWSAFLIFPILAVPRFLIRAGIVLLGVEFLALLMWSYGSESCAERPCGAFAEAARSAATQDLPLLTAVLLGSTIVYGVRARARASAS